MSLVATTIARVASVLALAVLFLTGCGAKQGTSSHPVALRWANEGISDLYTLDPARGPDYNARQAVQLIFGGLVRFGPRFTILPDAAQHWTVSGDARTYTFQLRPNLQFADGSHVTASDVAYSINRALQPALAAKNGATYLLGDIDGADAVMAGHAKEARGLQVVDDSTIRIRLHAPVGYFLSKLANPTAYIVPRKLIERAGVHWDNKAMGTGPFMVHRWVHNDALLLVPNPHYYGGKLAIAGIDMPFISEELTAYKRYRAGSVDLTGTIRFPTEVVYDVKGRKDFRQQARLETVFLTLNERRKPFNDERVRLAFAHALDKGALVRTVYDGFAHPTDGMMPPGLPGYNPHLKGASFNPTLARTLLARAGFPGGKGFPEISFPVDQSAQNFQLVNALAQQWRRVLGVSVQPVQYNHSSYLSLLTRLDYQIGVIDWTADYPDPQNFISQQLHTGVPNNNGGWSNREFDRLVDRADRLMSDDPQRMALYHRAEQLAMSQAATIPLVNPSAGILLRPDVHGLDVSGGRILVQDWTQVSLSPGGTR